MQEQTMHRLNVDDLKILGLGPDADLDAVEKAYALIARRNNSDIKDGSITPEGEELMTKMSSAYSRLIGKKDPALKVEGEDKGGWFVGFNRTSVDNFFYLFKLQFILGLAGIIIASVLIYGLIDRPSYQFSIAYWGPVIADNEGVTALVKTSDSSIKNVQYFESLGAGVSSDAPLAVYMLAVLDTIVTNKDTYKSFATQGFFLNLDSLAKEAGIDISKQQDFLITSVKSADGVPHLYGLDVSKIKALNKIFFTSNSVLAIPTNTVDLEPGKKFMREMMKIAAAELNAKK